MMKQRSSSEVAQQGVMQRAALVGLVCLAMMLPASAQAQQPTRRRQAPIEIRGQVPTPQVVTVRPREMPAYSRQVLVPRFFDHDFWPEIQLGYQMVPERQISGRTIADTLMTSSDSAAMPGARRLAPPSRPNFTPGSDSAKAPVVPPPAADSARRRPGTAPAR